MVCIEYIIEYFNVISYYIVIFCNPRVKLDSIAKELFCLEIKKSGTFMVTRPLKSEILSLSDMPY